jgi:RHS repeat-associated protein
VATHDSGPWTGRLGRASGLWLAVFLSWALGLASPVVSAQGIAGDADANGRIGQGDVTAILDAILQVHPAPGNPDCNGDSAVNILDVICVQRTIAQTTPAITDFAPRTATAGTLVTVQGSHFAAGGVPPGVNLARQGGGSMAAPVTSFSDGSLAFVVPAGAATGLLTVLVPERPATASTDPLTIRPRSGFTLRASPASLDVIRGQSAAYAVSLDSTDGFSQLAELSVSGLPAGVTAAFDPPRLAAGQTSILTLQATASAPTGSATLSLTAAATVDGVALSQQTAVGAAVRPITTSFFGRIVVSDPQESPLTGVVVTFAGSDGNGHATGCTGQTATDAAGNFSFTDLPAACVGAQILRFDGTTATSPPGVYAALYKAFTLVSGQAVAPMAVIHLPRIDNSETVLVHQNYATAQSFTFQSIPNLAITVPAGTTLTLEDGSRPDPFPLLAVQVPLDRLPGPMPPNSSAIVPFIVGFQPERATASLPIAVYFPNAIGTRPGTQVTLITLDPTRGIMVPYGTGVISTDGRQIVPDFDPAHPGLRYGLVHMGWHGPVQPPPPAVSPAPPSSGVCPKGSRPVDPASGLDVMTNTDFSLPGARGGGLTIVRTYRTLSGDAGPFGLGASHNYDYRLDNNSPNTAAMVSLILPDGRRVPFTRDASGQLTNATIPDFSGAVLTTYDDRTSQLRFKQGAVLHFIPTDIVNGCVVDSITDRYGNQTSLMRPADRLRRIDQLIDPVGRKLRFSYDANDRVTSITDPIGRMVSYTYNAQGTVATFTDPEGGVERYDYDVQNRLSQVTDARGIVVARNTYDANGRVIEQIQADGGRWTFSYVLVNAQLPSSPVAETTVTDPLGHTTVYRFNPEGFLLDVTDALGQTRVLEREPGTNRLLSIKGTAECDICGAPGAGDEAYTYDANGNVLTQTDALGHTLTRTWDPVTNQVASTTDPLGHTRSFTYGANGELLTSTDENSHTTAITYDPFGLPLQVTDPAGKLWKIDYDGYGNPVRITDPLGNATLRRYDAISRLIESLDPLGRSTKYVYDGLNRVTRITDPLGNATRFAYDPAGNLLSLTDARNHTTSSTYDPMGRVATRTDPLGKISRWTYDFRGNVTRFEDRRGRVAQLTYDPLDRLIQEIYPDATVARTYDPRGLLLRVEDSAGGVFSYEYDLVGSLLRAVGPTGTIAYTRDPLNRVSRRQVVSQPPLDLAYDPAGNLLSAALPPASVTFAYDERDQLMRQSRSNGVVTDSTFDAAGRVLSLIDSRGAQTINTQRYTYDAAGQRTSYSNGISQPLTTQTSVNTIDPQSDRMLQRGAVSYTYDEEGNRLTESGPAGTTSYTWDTRGRLQSIVFPDGTAASFQYDWAGNLIQKAATGLTESYVLDEITNVAYQTDSAGLRLSVLSGPGIDQHLGVVKGDGSFELGLTNAINSTVATVDQTGSVLGQFFYEPFGETTVTGGTVFPFRFTGRTQVVGDLYNSRLRVYDPLSGRFLSEDPIGFAAGYSNLYKYVGNDPVGAVDPLGTITIYNGTEGSLAFLGAIFGGAGIAVDPENHTAAIRVCIGIGGGFGGGFFAEQSVESGSVEKGFNFDSGFYAGAQAAYGLGAGVSGEIVQDLKKTKCKGQGIELDGSVGTRLGLGAEATAGWRFCTNYGFSAPGAGR